MKMLEHSDFEETEVETSHSLMQMRSSRLRQEGHTRGMKWLNTFQLLGEDMQMSLDFAGDEWAFICWARVRLIAVSSGNVVVLPWEKLLSRGALPEIARCA